MSRPIDADALRKKATVVTEYDEGGWGVDLLAVPLCDVELAPTIEVEPAQKWISVKDRLPNGWVLIDPDTDYREPETYIVFVEGAMLPTTAYFMDGEFVPPCEGGCIHNCGFINRITHWMPLPKPPAMEEEEA